MAIDDAGLRTVLAKALFARDQLLAVELGAIDPDEERQALYEARQDLEQACDLLCKAMGWPSCEDETPHLRLVWPAPNVDDDIPF